MSMLQITPVDHGKEEDGSWGSYLGVPLLIARSNNAKFKKMFRRLSKPYKKQIDKGTIDDDTALDIMCKSIAYGVLNSWDKTKMPGNPEYSEENAVDLLKNDPDCLDYVQEYSNDLDNYIKEDIEEVVKES